MTTKEAADILPFTSVLPYCRRLIMQINHPTGICLAPAHFCAPTTACSTTRHNT
jgi:hypothetical protein